jgi:hypothetical protein
MRCKRPPCRSARAQHALTAPRALQTVPRMRWHHQATLPRISREQARQKNRHRRRCSYRCWPQLVVLCVVVWLVSRSAQSGVPDGTTHRRRPSARCVVSTLRCHQRAMCRRLLPSTTRWRRFATRLNTVWSVTIVWSYVCICLCMYVCVYIYVYLCNFVCHTGPAPPEANTGQYAAFPQEAPGAHYLAPSQAGSIVADHYAPF